MEENINSILEVHKLNQLKINLKKRKFLNQMNILLLYSFHLIQSLGILTTSFAVTSHDTKFIWLGVCLNTLATIIQIYEKINIGLLKKIMVDIIHIKNNSYVDESSFIDTDENI